MTGPGLLVFGGSGSPTLTNKICSQLRVRAGRSETLRFSDGNLFVRILENVRGRHVYLVQSISTPTNDNFVELLFWIDAFKRASASSVTAVIPYFSYAKGDKKDEPRVSIRARVCAEALEAAGVDRLVTLDLHAPQIQGFFRVPVDDLHALRPLCDAIKALQLEDPVVVSPDAGFAKKARKYATYLNAPMAIADKQRSAHDEKAAVIEVIGDVNGKSAVIVDDFVVSGGTLVEVAKKLTERGAKSIHAAVTHGVFSGTAAERLDPSPIQLLFTTDSVENPKVTTPDKVRMISVAPLFAEAIHRIENRESVSVLFQ